MGLFGHALEELAWRRCCHRFCDGQLSCSECPQNCPRTAVGVQEVQHQATAETVELSSLTSVCFGKAEMADPISNAVAGTIGGMDEDEHEALIYYMHVVKGLSCCSHSTAIPPELKEAWLVGRKEDLSPWKRWRREAWSVWRRYVELERSSLGLAPVTGLPASSPLVAVIVELREHADFDFVLRKTLSVLDQSRWALLIIHGTANEDFVRRTVRGWSVVHLRSIGTVDLSPQEYANWRRSDTFLSMIEEVCAGTGVALHFECDSVMLRRGCEKFLRFDLVGAPWSWAVIEGLPHVIGNGGLCLRNIGFCRAALQHMGATADGVVQPPFEPRNEDISFAKAAVKMGARIPSLSEATAFSVETVFHPKPFGMHKAWNYLLPSQLCCVLGLSSNI
eukprot:TRINITY_DN67852_c0_g1_i1.p1 TRINITY_DN67852_c0_g1~~TRINITY_DN67852_c0_g1_i1.p1  ORF type:complete len:392 (+),score=59.17 TRINITY_DN67852_c0_g1_i1:172-1347(+)